MIYLQYRENNIHKKLDFIELFYNNFYTIIIILLLNWIMLLFGYLGEIKILPLFNAVLFGFIPFIIYYYIIYIKYAILTNNGLKIYFYFLFFWSLYVSLLFYLII